MNRLIALVVILFIIFCSSIYAEISVPEGFWKGNDWRASDDEARTGYAMGIIDGIILASAIERSGSSLAWVSPCTKGMRNDQIRAIIQKELDKNPEKRHLPMNIITYKALRNVCPNSPKLRWKQS